MIKALLFDMDGILVNTEKVHQKARRLTYDHYKIDYNTIKHIPVIGRNTDAIFKDIEKVISFPVSLKEASRYKRDIFVSLINNDPIPPLDGIVDILNKYSKKLRIAIVSSSCKTNMEAVLRNSNLKDFFELIISAEDVTNCKPDPEGYKAAAKTFNLEPSECIVFEDSGVGIKAGKASGATVIGVYTSPYPEDLSQADYTIKNIKHGLDFVSKLIDEK